MLAATEVTCDVIGAVTGLAVALVAAYVTIRTRAMDARHTQAELKAKRCRRAYRRLKARVVELEANQHKKPLDKRSRPG